MAAFEKFIRHVQKISFSTCLVICNSSWSSEWPSIELPASVEYFSVGEQFTSNGLPIRAKGFIARDKSAQEMAAWFRRSLGQPLVENKLGNKIILGRAQNSYYLSVQIEPVNSKNGTTASKGLVAVSDIATFNRNRDKDAADAQLTLARWPSGTRMLNRLASHDGDKSSVHITLQNGQSVSLNRDILIASLKDDGLFLMQENSLPEKSSEGISNAHQEAKILFFKGTKKEGIATITRDTNGGSIVIFNTTSNLEGYRQ